MANDPQKIRHATAAEAVPLLMLAAGDDVQGLGLADILSGCQFFILDGEGNALAYAVKRCGSELWVQAAGGTGEADLTSLMIHNTEKQARAAGLSSVGFQTRRKGLVKKALQGGFFIDGFILRKKINV